MVSGKAGWLGTGLVRGGANGFTNYTFEFFVSVMWKPNFYQTQVFEVIVLVHMHKFSWARAAERNLEPVQASTGFQQKARILDGAGESANLIRPNLHQY